MVQVRPRSLTIENSGLALFRDGAFAHFGTGLKELLLGGNIFKKIDANMLSDVPRLQTLDLHSTLLIIFYSLIGQAGNFSPFFVSSCFAQ